MFEQRRVKPLVHLCLAGILAFGPCFAFAEEDHEAGGRPVFYDASRAVTEKQNCWDGLSEQELKLITDYADLARSFSDDDVAQFLLSEDSGPGGKVSKELQALKDRLAASTEGHRNAVLAFALANTSERAQSLVATKDRLSRIADAVQNPESPRGKHLQLLKSRGATVDSKGELDLSKLKLNADVEPALKEFYPESAESIAKISSEEPDDRRLPVALGTWTVRPRSTGRQGLNRWNDPGFDRIVKTTDFEKERAAYLSVAAELLEGLVRKSKAANGLFPIIGASVPFIGGRNNERDEAESTSGRVVQSLGELQTNYGVPQAMLAGLQKAYLEISAADVSGSWDGTWNATGYFSAIAAAPAAVFLAPALPVVAAAGTAGTAGGSAGLLATYGSLATAVAFASGMALSTLELAGEAGVNYAHGRGTLFCQLGKTFVNKGPGHFAANLAASVTLGRLLPAGIGGVAKSLPALSGPLAPAGQFITARSPTFLSRLWTTPQGRELSKNATRLLLQGAGKALPVGIGGAQIWSAAEYEALAKQAEASGDVGEARELRRLRDLALVHAASAASNLAAAPLEQRATDLVAARMLRPLRLRYASTGAGPLLETDIGPIVVSRRIPGTRQRGSLLPIKEDFESGSALTHADIQERAFAPELDGALHQYADRNRRLLNSPEYAGAERELGDAVDALQEAVALVEKAKLAPQRVRARKTAGAQAHLDQVRARVEAAQKSFDPMLETASDNAVQLGNLRMYEFYREAYKAYQAAGKTDAEIRLLMKPMASDDYNTWWASLGNKPAATDGGLAIEAESLPTSLTTGKLFRLFGQDVGAKGNWFGNGNAQWDPKFVLAQNVATGTSKPNKSFNSLELAQSYLTTPGSKLIVSGAGPMPGRNDYRSASGAPGGVLQFHAGMFDRDPAFLKAYLPIFDRTAKGRLKFVDGKAVVLGKQHPTAVLKMRDNVPTLESTDPAVADTVLTAGKRFSDTFYLTHLYGPGSAPARSSLRAGEFQLMKARELLNSGGLSTSASRTLVEDIAKLESELVLARQVVGPLPLEVAAQPILKTGRVVLRNGLDPKEEDRKAQ